jgi:hypothetical protein
MRSDRLARTLLRLYPRAWRERYGEELLALIDDAGLTWRIVADVIAGATVERVRALMVMRNRPRDPIAEARAKTLLSFRESATELLAQAALVVMTIGALTVAGVPWPRWQSWYLIAMINVPLSTP